MLFSWIDISSAEIHSVDILLLSLPATVLHIVLLHLGVLDLIFLLVTQRPSDSSKPSRS